MTSVLPNSVATVTLLERSTPPTAEIPITDAMKVFLASLPNAKLLGQQTLLARLWGHEHRKGLGALFSLLWDGILNLHRAEADPIRAALAAVAGEQLDFSHIHLQRLRMSASSRSPNLSRISFEKAVLVDVDLSDANLTEAQFSGTMLENVKLSDACLVNALFTGAYVADVECTGATLTGADFRGVSPENISILVEPGDSQVHRYEGELALGYLRFNGALTDDVQVLAVVYHHPRYDIVEKTLRRLSEQGSRQRRGLVQRGAAQRDLDFAEELVTFLEAEGYIQSRRGRREQVALTETGRDVVGRVLERGDLPEKLEAFFLDRLGSHST